MRVIIVKRIKMERQLKGTCHMLSCIKRIIAVRGFMHTCHLPVSPLTTPGGFCLEGNSMRKLCTGQKQNMQ